MRLAFRRSWGGLSLAFALIVLAGCSNSKPMGTIKGKVTYKGNPVTTGSVNFMMAEKGSAAQADLDANGQFSIKTPLEAGTYKVYLTPPLPEQLPPGQVSKRPPFNIPPKFQDPNQSTISKEIKAGDNDIPIDFVD